MLAIKRVIKGVCCKTIANNLSTKAAFPKEETIEIGKYKINYVKVGNGPHNVFCTPGCLGTVCSHLRPLSEGMLGDKFSVVVWDPPGYGKSFPRDKEFTIDFLEKDADFAYAFMKALNISKFSVLGFSDGVMTSVMLAAKYPEAVTKLVIWGGNTFIMPHELKAYRKMKDVSNWSQRHKQTMAGIYGEEKFVSYWEAWVYAMEEIYRTKNGDICSEHLKNISCPTFILFGEKDPLVDPSHASYQHKHIKGSRMHLYPEGQHFLHFQYPEDFSKRVQEFLLE